MAHTHTNLLIHIVFATQNREPFLDAELRPRLFSYMSGIMKRLGSEPLLINGTKDHIHLLIDIPPKLCVSDLVEKVKANSSKWIHETYPAKRHFAWQRGYSAFSVSPSNRKKVLDYIVGQEEHHRHRSYQEELLDFYSKAGISIDPRWGLD